MGDLVTKAVEGTLYYLPFNQFEWMRNSEIEKEKKMSIFSDMCRLNALYMIARAGSGHIGSSFSSMDIFSWLQLEELQNNDVFFSSKGHDAPGYYSVLLGLGKLEFNLIHKLRRVGGLPGHPDVGTHGIVTNTGSLGMGVSKAKGMIFANRLKGRDGRVFVLTGDGELQEGQFWESLISAANNKMSELVVIIDHNKLQSDTFVKNVSDLGDLEAKLLSFGWCVERCNGNDVDQLRKAYTKIKLDKRPKVIIADTVKGKGVSFMEHTSLDSDVDMYRFHSGAPDATSYQKAAQEIIERLNNMVNEVNGEELKFETVERVGLSNPSNSSQRLVNAYSEALIEQAKMNGNLVALDADLVLDTGLIPFREKYPNRFFECGIAEQDMVSMAGGMALNGLLPIVHSFACFLSSRPNEQIYNNSTEKSKIIYVGSLAGILPAGPGHSHQAVRDITSLCAIPNLIIVEPSCAPEVSLLLDWCINRHDGSSYIRLVSIPCEIPYVLPSDYSPEIGKGVVLKDGNEICLIAYGPIMLANAHRAALAIENESGKSVCVINMPWLNFVDGNWLSDNLLGFDTVVVIENQYINNSIADLLAEKILEKGIKINNFKKIGLIDIPKSGSNEEVLRHHSLDFDSIKKSVLEILI